jgi:hypothetical protein
MSSTKCSCRKRRWQDYVSKLSGRLVRWAFSFLNKGWINRAELVAWAKIYTKTEYGDYLNCLAGP